MTGRADRIRVGVVGVDRGLGLARCCRLAGLELTALCDRRLPALQEAGARLGIATYADLDAMLEAPVDAVVLANAFHEHARLALRVLAAGKHVLSETTACMTLAEGVALVRAVEASDCVYMLAENYAYTRPVQEMRRLYHDGEIGEVRYAEGEYVHPMSADWLNLISPGLDHWRNWLPVTYYCTHSLAPLMAITGTRPVAVNGVVVPYDPDDANKARTARRMDTASMVAVRMDNGALVKLLQYDLRGEGTWVRVHGNRGLMETLRHGSADWVRVVKEPWDRRDGEPAERLYRPPFAHGADRAARAGHGGSDYFVLEAFATAIRTGEPPLLDVHSAVAMSAVGIQAYRSALADGAPVKVPDLRDATTLERHTDDDWSPDPAVRRAGQPWPSVLGDVRPPAAGVRVAEAAWAAADLPPALSGATEGDPRVNDDGSVVDG